MRLKKDSTEQKLRGAYYTPLALANAMVGLFTDDIPRSVLEPSCGDGVFIDSLQSSGMLDRIDTLTAVEIEAAEAQKVLTRYSDVGNVKVLVEDFLEFYKRCYQKERYDLILGNPPYIRYQYLTEAQREIQAQILTSHGMKSNKLINSWVCFLVACVQMLSVKGKIAFVVPAEILQVAYAEDLRLFLTNQLSRITLITFEKLIFPEIEQEVCVLVGEKGGEEKGIRIIQMDTLDDFKALDLSRNGYQKVQHVKEKWTKYFVLSTEAELVQILRADDRDDLVVGHQLGGQGGGLGRLGLVVVLDDFDLLAVDPAGGVDLFDGHLDALDAGVTVGGDRPREFVVEANLDGVRTGT